MSSAKVSEHIVVVIWTIDYAVRSPLADAIKTWILRKVDVMRWSM